MALDDSLLRNRPKSTLLPGWGNKVAARPPELEPEARTDDSESGRGDDVESLPKADSPYTAAYSRPSNKPELALHVFLRDGFSKGFAWSNFDSVDTAPGDQPGGAPIVVVRFAGLTPTELRICISPLDRLLALIGRHRIAWIREAPSTRGFPRDATAGAPMEVITAIAVQRWKPESGR